MEYKLEFETWQKRIDKELAENVYVDKEYALYIANREYFDSTFPIGLSAFIAFWVGIFIAFIIIKEKRW